MLTSLGITNMGQETYVVHRKRDLFDALKATMQQPPLGPFHKFDIQWLPRVTHGGGLYTHCEIAMIL
jgi:hypothetical protein